MMKSKKHTEFIWEYENVTSKEECSHILSLIRNSKLYDQVIEKKEHRSKVRNNSSINVTQAAQYDKHMNAADYLIHKLFSSVHQHYLNHNKSYFALSTAQYLCNMTCSYTYRTYDESDYYDWHIDSSETSRLLLSYILYLNDDFDGGNTLFLHQRKKVVPKVGSMLCFPCDFQTVHKSSPIRRGRKDIIWTCMEYCQN